MTWLICTNFHSPFPRRLHKNLALIGHAVSGVIFENVTYRCNLQMDGQTDDRKTLGILEAHLVSLVAQAC